MPHNKPVLVCASGVVVLAALAHLARPSCPIHDVKAQSRQIVVTDPQWGILENMQPKQSGSSGELFEATENIGQHRVLRSARVSTSGGYEVAIETRYLGTSGMEFEAGGPGQAYHLVRMNLKDGSLKTEAGPAVASVEHLDQSGAYRWRFNVNVNPGDFDYNFALLAQNGESTFSGSGTCKVILSEPNFSARPLPQQ